MVFDSFEQLQKLRNSLWKCRRETTKASKLDSQESKQRLMLCNLQKEPSPNFFQKKETEEPFSSIIFIQSLLIMLTSIFFTLILPLIHLFLIDSTCLNMEFITNYEHDHTILTYFLTSNQ